MPNVDRRDFLKLVGAGGVGVGAGFMLAETIKHPIEHLIPYPVPPEEFSPGIATWYNSVCSLCAAGCGISVRTREGRAKKIEGNPAHPVSQGGLCALGQAGLQVLYNPDRLTAPVRLAGERGSSFEEITWDEGLATVGGRLDLLRAAGRGNRIALLSAGVRGHLASLLELFMEQLGSSRLLHYEFAHPQTLYSANERFFGETNLPYYDLKNTRYLLSFGADYLGNWLSPVHHGLGFGHSRQGQPGARARSVQVEPRMSLSGAAADEWIPAEPGTEGVLALGLARWIVTDGDYQGPDRDAWQAALDSYTPASVARQTGVAAATVERLAAAFAGTRPSLAIGGGAAANHINGTDTLLAVNALNYLAGNVGVAGGLLFNPAPAFGPASGTRQANFTSMLALAEAARRGEIEVLIVNGANPVFGLPTVAGFAEALAEIPLIVSLSSFLDDTTALADIILPSHSYLESWGDDVPEPGVGFSTGALSQPVVSPLYNTRATGDIILALATHMNLDAVLAWPTFQDYLQAGWREIYQRGSADNGFESFEAFWQAVARAGVWGEDRRRDQAFSLNPAVIDTLRVVAPDSVDPTNAYPFVLHPYLSNSLRDGRGANLPWLQELPDALTSIVYGSWVELNPTTADRLGLSEGDLVDLESPHGRIRAPVFVYPAIMPTVVAMPIGQGHGEYGRYAKGRGANPLQILAPEVDAIAGSLAWAATRVRLIPTGKHRDLVKTGGTPRQLGRNIVQIAAADSSRSQSVGLKSIPIKVAPV